MMNFSVIYFCCIENTKGRADKVAHWMQHQDAHRLTQPDVLALIR
jgi:hypothetical protein